LEQEIKTRLNTIIKTSAFRIAGHFADVNEFSVFIINFLVSANCPFEKDRIIRSLHDCAEKYIFLQNDIALLEKEIITSWDELVQPFDIRIENFQRKASGILNDCGFNIKPPSVFIVDALPAPFDATTFDAVCIDKFDEEDFKIPKGIYFVRDEIIPDLTIHNYAHEMVHLLVDNFTNERMLARGLEEGICELFGALYLESRVRGIDLAFNIHRNSMFSYNQDSFWDYYVHYTRQIHWLYDVGGISGICELIQNGRNKIKLYEEAFIKGDWEKPNKVVGVDDEEFGFRLNRLLLGFNKNYVVTPDLYFLLKHIRPGITLEALSKLSGVNSDILDKMLRDFQEEHFLILYQEKKIYYSDIRLYLKEGLLRYKII